MTTTELIKSVSKKMNVSQAQAKREIEALRELLLEQLEDGKSYTFSGFGTFYVQEKEQKKGYNPAEKKPMIIPRKKVLQFKISSVLKEKVKGLKFDA